MVQIGNYELIKQIGEGGFGRTYEAVHIHLQEKACLKENVFISAEDSEFLKREAKLLWNVCHYSLPVMRDFFTLSAGNSILVMQFIEGRELQKTITKHGALDSETVCWITQRLLNALYYLHSKAIIHGDVKPANVIVQPETHNAVLVDYGLASLKPKSTNKPLGYTMLYAAPETIEGLPPIPETDLYSLGLTMLAALGGDPTAKTFPPAIAQELQDYFSRFFYYDPMKRPNWQKNNLVGELSDLRMKLFGRKHTL